MNRGAVAGVAADVRSGSFATGRASCGFGHVRYAPESGGKIRILASAAMDLCRTRHLRARNLVERFFNKTKQCRRVATRHDKLAAYYLAFIQLASIRLWLRVNESTP